MPKPLTVWITTNGKILQEMGIPDHLSCLWETCMQVMKQKLEPDTEKCAGSKSGTEYSKLLLSCLFKLYVEYIKWNAGLDDAQAGIKISGRNINNLRYADDTTLMAESKEELKSLLMKVKEESENAGLKLNIQKTKIMAPSPNASWLIYGETMETVTDFIFLDSKITAEGDCSLGIKRCLLFGRKTMISLDSILKSRDTTLLTKVPIGKAMVFLVVMYGCKSWTIKKVEHQGADAFFTVVLEKIHESSLDCKEIKPVNHKRNQS